MPPIPRTELGRELFELMQEPSGATPSAIRTKPGLMNLSYIRAEAPSLDDNEAQEEAIAVTVRGFLEQATYALEEPISQREDKDSDKGAAVRCLLGLQSGTDSLLLAERRKRAAGFAIKKVRSMTKQRSVRNHIESYETILMDRLADQLSERETDFLRGRSDDDTGPIQPDEHLLQLVHEVWDTAGELESSLGVACELVPFNSDEDRYPFGHDIESLYLFGKFWKLVLAPEYDFVEAVMENKTPVAELSPHMLTAQMFLCAPPCSLETIGQLARSLPAGPHVEPRSVIMQELSDPWRTWLESCICREGSQPDCKVHRFRETLLAYRKTIEECWADLRDPYRHPAMHGIPRTSADILEVYRIHPTIDIIK